MGKVASIILIAGESKRIRSSISKVFHEIADKPLIEYVYSITKKISPKNIIFVCNKKNINEISKNFTQAKTVIQKKPKGTADVQKI
jgi:bifunctional N-acetylglucosamine-1-phosphate-uridyltransferase/glucosamine-1-phosphate-acetyltransferase GlmU-like protein